MELFDLDIVKYLFCFGLALLVNYIVFKRIVFSIIDPWVSIAIAQSFNLAYALYAYIQGDILAINFWYLIISYFSFVVGLYLFYRKQETMPHNKLIIFTPGLLRVTIIMICFYQLFFDVLFFLSRGIPALSPDGISPTMYKGGFGIVKYIHDSAGPLLSILAFKALLFYKRKKLFYFSMFFVIYPLLLMEWGKGAIINIFYIYGVSVYYLNKYYGLNLTINYKKLVKFIPILFAFVFYKFMNVVTSGYEETVLLAILKRYINSSDSIYMYFTRGAYQYLEAKLNLGSFLISHVAPFFGYIDFLAVNLATVIYEYAIGEVEYGTGYGTSSALYVIGHLVFANYGFIYCFLVGIVLSVVKFTRTFKPNYVFFIFIYGIAPALTGDASLVMYYLFTLLVLSPVIILSFLMFAAVTKCRASIGRKYKQLSFSKGDSYIVSEGSI